MAVINNLPTGSGIDQDALALKYSGSGSNWTTSQAYTNVLVQIAIGGSSSYQNVSYSETPDKVIALKVHTGSYWGTWLYYEYLPAGTLFTCGNSGGYAILTIVQIDD